MAACMAQEIQIATGNKQLLQNAWKRYLEKPQFHLAPASGWINDPNGPLYHNGRYHMFYQHVPGSSEWQWGLVWGHAVSQDLVTWRHLPIALEPTPGSHDEHGCFSGCAAIDPATGLPTLLYTGAVRKVANEVVEGDIGHYETQLMAVAADPDDPDLKYWRKLPHDSHATPCSSGFLPLPPPEWQLTGWRDPFVIQTPSTSSPYWMAMVGAGVRGEGGTALVYRSKQLHSNWEFVGELCRGDASTGAMWECPLLAKLASDPSGAPSAPARGLTHLLCVSPDSAANMSTYWLGSYSNGRFDMAAADGPHPLDLGDVLYAPNLLEDAQGRTLLWGWMQESNRPGSAHDHACCLSVPRLLSLRNGRLHQQPLPELAELRVPGSAWAAGSGGDGPGVLLAGGHALDVAPGLRGEATAQLDVEVEVTRSSDDATGFALLLPPLEEGCAGAAVVFSWLSGTLNVVRGCEPRDLSAALQAGGDGSNGTAQSRGGRVHLAEGQRRLRLRVLVDGSLVEVFTCTGQVLGTRAYRATSGSSRSSHGSSGVAANGNGDDAAAGCMQLLAFGGVCEVSAAAWQVRSAWLSEGLALPLEVAAPEAVGVAGDTAVAGPSAGAQAVALPARINDDEALQVCIAAATAAVAAATAAAPVRDSPLLSPRADVAVTA